MKKEISQKFKWGERLSILTMLLGIILMVYMIKFEDEPGALPLLLIILGTVWLILNQYRIKKPTVSLKNLTHKPYTDISS